MLLLLPLPLPPFLTVTQSSSHLNLNLSLSHWLCQVFQTLAGLSPAKYNSALHPHLSLFTFIFCLLSFIFKSLSQSPRHPIPPYCCYCHCHCHFTMFSFSTLWSSLFALCFFIHINNQLITTLPKECLRQESRSTIPVLSALLSALHPLLLAPCPLHFLQQFPEGTDNNLIIFIPQLLAPITCNLQLVTCNS